MVTESQSFGERLQALRKARGWTQLDASEVFKVRESTVANWEAGRNEPSGPAHRLLEQLEAESKKNGTTKARSIRTGS